jgi:hypothetical protein
MADVINRQIVPIMVNGHTFVITSRLIFSQVFSLPNAFDVKINDVTKKITVRTDEIITGALLVTVFHLSEPDDVEEFVVVFALILYEYIFICYLLFRLE